MQQSRILTFLLLGPKLTCLGDVMGISPALRRAPCYTATMPDTPSQSAAQHAAARHTLSVREVEVLLAQAGVQRSHRHVLRLCQSGMLDAVKMPGGPSGDEWYVSPASVPKAIGDLRQIDGRRERRSTPEHAMSHTVAVENDGSFVPAMARRSTPEPAAAVSVAIENSTPSEPDTARHGAADLDVYDHPYVKRLERQVEKLESKYEAQVRRTEEVQLKAHDKLVELQRMTTIGQSKTLADFMLQAKNWLVGPPPDDILAAEGERPAAPAGQSADVDNIR